MGSKGKGKGKKGNTKDSFKRTGKGNKGSTGAGAGAGAIQKPKLQGSYGYCHKWGHKRADCRSWQNAKGGINGNGMSMQTAPMAGSQYGIQFTLYPEHQSHSQGDQKAARGREPRAFPVQCQQNQGIAVGTKNKGHHSKPNCRNQRWTVLFTEHGSVGPCAATAIRK